VSPRSAEFLKAAKERLNAARVVLAADPSTALSTAYYAMLYAARAALSEVETYAKTHSGTWDRFYVEFVRVGRFDAQLAQDAREVQPEREDADYEAWTAPAEEAERVIELAARFITEVETRLAESATEQG
jgi:uncharacterized protein (UPF0332 family)